MAHLRETFSTLLPCPPRARLVCMPGTMPTLFAEQHALIPYDTRRVHGGTLLRVQFESMADSVCGLPLGSTAVS